MTIKVGINGFGRIGRIVFRACLPKPDIEISAINDPAIDAEYICYLIKFDSTHGKYEGDITHTEDEIKINGNNIKVFNEKLPASIPWQTVGTQYVVEASGIFTSLEKASGHLASDGIRRVIVTAPSLDVPMVILGVNDSKLNAEQKVISCTSSTLYCLAPIMKVLDDNFGVVEGFITSIHAMTPSLKPLDGLCLRGKHWRDHRSIHQNIIPATTGACKALGKIIPQMKDKMTGLAFRVPIVNVSVLDLTIRLTKNTSLQEIVNSVMKAGKTVFQDVMKVSNEAAVSSDFLGDKHSCILDVDSSLQLKPNFFKLICWYENEFSYACRVIDSIFFSERQFYQIESKMTYVRPRASKKQDSLQQTECNKKEISVECRYNAEVDRKLLSSTSQDSRFKTNPPHRTLVFKKPIAVTSGSNLSRAVDRNPKKTHERFKIWNDISDVLPASQRQNRSSFFNSCIAIPPQIASKNNTFKSQECLEKVKREFSKMVNITEDLLKKCNSNKLQPDSASVIHPKNEMFESSVDNSDLNLKNEFTDTDLSSLKSTEIPKHNFIFDASGDFKASFCTINSNKFIDQCKEFHTLQEKDNKFNVKINKVKSVELKKVSLSHNYKENIVNDQQVDTQRSSKILDGQTTITISKENLTGKKIENRNKNICAKETFVKSVYKIMQIHCLLNNKNLTTKCAYQDYNQPESNITKVVPKVYDKEANIGNYCNSVNEVKNCELENSTQRDCDGSLLVKANLKGIEHETSNPITLFDAELKKRNILLVNDKKYNEISPCQINKNIYCNSRNITNDEYITNTMVAKDIIPEEIIYGFSSKPAIIESEDTSVSDSPITLTTVNNAHSRNYQDIYDKLDSASATDSENSFEINERKSEVIKISDLSNSLDDLERLDKICRIIEISDELSDKLFSALDKPDDNGIQRKTWSFKDLCERIKLDEFCSKVFGKSSA